MRSSGPGNLSGIGFDFTGQDLQEGGFARAVGTDEAIAIAGGEFDVDVFEQNAFAKGQGNVCGADHGSFLIRKKPQGKIPVVAAGPVPALELL